MLQVHHRGRVCSAVPARSDGAPVAVFAVGLVLAVLEEQVDRLGGPRRCLRGCAPLRFGLFSDLLARCSRARSPRSSMARTLSEGSKKVKRARSNSRTVTLVTLVNGVIDNASRRSRLRRRASVPVGVCWRRPHSVGCLGAGFRGRALPRCVAGHDEARVRFWKCSLVYADTLAKVANPRGAAHPGRASGSPGDAGVPADRRSGGRDAGSGRQRHGDRALLWRRLSHGREGLAVVRAALSRRIHGLGVVRRQPAVVESLAPAGHLVPRIGADPVLTARKCRLGGAWGQG